MTKSNSKCPLCFDASEAPAQVFYEGTYFRVMHRPVPCPVSGWLLIVPNRHVTSQREFTSDEKVELSFLQFQFTEYLETYLKVKRVYWAVFAEVVPHIHFHLIPRSDTLPAHDRGHRIFEISEAITPEQMDSFSTGFAEFLSKTL